MRDAESLLDQCISAAEEKIDLDTVRKVLGLVDSQIVSGLLDAVSRRDRNEALSVVDRVTASGMDLEEFFIGFIEGIRNLLVISVSAGRTDWLDLTSGEIEELSAIAEKFEIEDLLFIFRSMSRAHRELKGTSNPRYHIEAAVAEAASWESAVEIGELISRLESGEGGASAVSGSAANGSGAARRGQAERPGAAEGSGPAMSSAMVDAAAPSDSPAAGASPAEEPAAGPSGTPEIPVRENPLLEALGGRDEWERFLAQVREAKLTVGIWLMSAEVAGIEDGNLILSFSPQNRFAMAMIRDAKNRRLIEDHLEKFYGRKFTVETCETVDIKVGSPDNQAKMEIDARTKPRPGGKEPEGAEEGPEPADRQVAGAKPGKKGPRAAKKKAGAAKTESPALDRIMKSLDAELLD